MNEDWPRPVVHWELEARDVELQRRFYAELFNWSVGDGPIAWVPAGFGGPEPGPAGHIRQGEASRVTLYVQVRELRAAIDKATALGGAALTEPFDLPGGPTMAGIADPEGNPLMLVQQ